jgi:hypothetical protein
MTGRDMVGAVIAIYGPKTTMIAYNSLSNTVDEWTLKEGFKSTDWYSSK